MDNVRLGPQQIRVLAHPLRARLLGMLRTGGPATATSLARELATNTGATSYHLRKLAEVGLVAEQEGAGGRQRPWKAVHQASNWNRSQFAGDPDAEAAADWLEDHQIQRLSERAAAWRSMAAGEPAAWRDTAGLSDYLLTLSPERARRLLDELGELVERYRAEPGDDEPGARPVAVYLGVLPR